MADGVRQKFTRKERDNETGLDYFLARYYSSTQARFTSPDHFDGNPAHLLNSFERSGALPYATLLNPQTINFYTYAYNNPLSYVDPDGHQGGKPQPLPGNKRYTIRPDLNNPNDSPNVHVFDRSGRREIGRVAVKGTTNAPVYEWSGKVPEGVKADVEAFLRQKGVQPRPPLHPRGPVGGTGPRGGGFRANGLAALALFSILLDGYNQYSHSQQFGYHFNYMGQMVVTDLAKTAQNLSQGQLIDFEGTIFKLKGDTFVSIDPDCEGCKLRQDKDGKLYIEGCKRCAEE